MKLLLFSDIPPSQNYSGGLVLKQLCEFLPEGSLSSVIVMNPDLNPDIPPNMEWIPMKKIVKPRDNWGTISRRRIIGETTSIVMETYNSIFRENEIIRSTVDAAREFNADAIWFIVEGHSMIRMEYKIAKALRIPVFTLVWDPPGWWLRENRVNRFTKKKTLERFNDLLRLSKRTATASWAMADQYRDIGANTIPLLASLDKDLAYEPAMQPWDRDEFIITIAGQTYATTEWESLLKALENLQWRINGKKIILRILSRYATMRANSASQIEFLGWRSQAETIDLLSTSDILFCPYWFNPEFATEARLSFPSKLTSYFASGRPLFFLGPPYSSPAILIEQQKVGLGCYSLNISDIASGILRLANDQKLYSSITSNASSFFHQNLTNEVLRSNFFEFLGLSQ